MLVTPRSGPVGPSLEASRSARTKCRLWLRRPMAKPARSVAAGILAVSSACFAGVLFAPTAAIAAETAVAAPLPSNAATPASGETTAIACPTEAWCVSVGNYTLGYGAAFIDTLSDGTWTSVEAPAPANISTPPEEALSGVSCAAVGSCVAVGYYVTDAGAYLGLVETLADGNWTASGAPLPANANTTAFVGLNGVDCLSDGSCVAVGQYIDTSRATADGDAEEGLVETLPSGSSTWSASEALTPAGTDPVASGGDGGLYGVSCSVDGSCVAVGNYITYVNGSYSPWLATLAAGSWSSVVPPLPGNLYTVSGEDNSFGNVLRAVSCTSAGACVAVGNYATGEQSFSPLIESLPSGSSTWAASEPVLPSGAASTSGTAFNVDAELWGVSCPTASTCEAVGYYPPSSGGTEGMLDTLAAGNWTSASTALPASAASGYDSGLNGGVDCVASGTAGTCESVGYFTQSTVGAYNDVLEGLIVTDTYGPAPTTVALHSSAGTVATATAVTFTAKISPNPAGGTVKFEQGTSVITGCATRPVAPATGKATCRTAFTSAGTYRIKAVYSGDTGFSGSTSPVLHQTVT